jgi:predicted nucleic-acid-binding Zn-ribbon protein
MTDPSAPRLACPLCRGTEFDQQQGRMDSRWGITSHRLTLLICRRCRYILQFYDKHSIFDFD